MEAFNLKPIIFDYFPPLYFIDDINKDSEDKGTNQRFHEMLADEWDEHLLPFAYNLVDTVFAEKTPDKFVPYIEQHWGVEEPLVEDLDTRRKIVKYLPNIYRCKGTLKSYQILFRVLGFSKVEVEDLAFSQGFDSPVTFDDVNRTFDKSECQTCSYYNLKLEGTMQINADLIALIKRAVDMVEPINAKLFSIIYNQVDVSFVIFVAENGDLIYEAVAGDDTRFTITSRGDLIASGSNVTPLKVS